MRRRRWGVVLGSAAFHALLVLLFVLDLDRGPVATPTPPMTVWLERPPISPSPEPSAPGKPRVRNTAPRPAVAPTPPVAAPSLPTAPAAPASPSVQGGGTAQAPAPSLRGLGGCRLATLDRLSPDARARCEEQLAQGGGQAAGPRPNLDPTGRYVQDPRPYLTRPPKDGCKPVGSVTKLPMGQTSVTLSGGCARSF